MPTRSAGGDDDVVDLEQVFLGNIQAAELGKALFENETSTHGVFHRGGLLEDFLQHEVRIAAPFDLLQVPLDTSDGLVANRRIEVEHLVTVAGDHGDIAIVEIDHVARVREYRRRVRSDEVFPVADTDQQRATVAGGHDFVLLVAGDGRESVGTVALPQRFDHGRFKVARVGHLNQMGEHFGVGVRLEHVTACFQPRLERRGVLDDAVVHDRDLAVLARMRMRIRHRRRAVRRPPGMGNAHRAQRGIVGDHRFESSDLARGTSGFQTFAVHDGDARRVIPPVLEALEPFKQHRSRDPITNVADDSAHGRSRSRVIRGPTTAPGPA